MSMICHAVIIQPDGSLTRCPEPMYFAGYGAYPYECRAKDLRPNAPIYLNCPANHQTWHEGHNDQEPR